MLSIKKLSINRSFIKTEELLYALYHFPLAITSPFISLYYFDLSGGSFWGSGLIIAIPYLFLIFSSGFFGKLSDKIGSKNLVLVSLSFLMLSFLSYYVIDENHLLFFLAYIGFNIMISAFTPAFNRVVSFQEAKKRANTFGKLGMWASAGFLCGSLLTAGIIDYLEFRVLFLLAAAFAFVTFLVALRLNDNYSTTNNITDQTTSSNLNMIKNEKKFNFLKPIMILLLIVLFTNVTNSLYFGFFAIFVEKELGLERSSIALVNTLATLIGVFTTYAVGRLAERYRKKNLILIALAFYFLLPFCTFLLSNSINSLNSHLILLLYSIPLYSVLFVIVPVFIAENTPESRRGQAMGLYTSSQYLGMTLGTVAGAYLATINGIIRPNFFASSIIAIFSILIGIFLFKESDNE